MTKKLRPLAHMAEIIARISNESWKSNNKIINITRGIASETSCIVKAV
jgi:hypothetical protein